MQNEQQSKQQTARRLRVYANEFVANNKKCVAYKTIAKFTHLDEAGVEVKNEDGSTKWFEHEVDLKFLQDANREDGLIVAKLIANNNGYLTTNNMDKPRAFTHYFSKKKQKEVYPEIWIKNIVKFEKAELPIWVNPYKQAFKRTDEIQDDEFMDDLPELPFDVD